MITLSKEQIDEIFDSSDNQWDAFGKFYWLVYPDYDEIVNIDGWPTVSGLTGTYIHTKFIEFDQEHHPEVLSGGLWMDKGFGIGDIEDWIVIPAPITLKEDLQC